MTEGLCRFYGGRDLHFLTFSCYQRRQLFGPIEHRDLFLEILERVRRRYRFVVLGYVVMPEHVHLLVSEPQRGTLSTVIQALKVGFVRSLEIRQIWGTPPRSRKDGETWGTPGETWGTPGETGGSPVNPRRAMKTSNHFWQARFYDFNVWTEKKRVEKLRYIHRNPVSRGLAASPDEWKWSSFRWYLRGEKGPVAINGTDILVMKISRIER